MVLLYEINNFQKEKKVRIKMRRKITYENIDLFAAHCELMIISIIHYCCVIFLLKIQKEKNMHFQQRKEKTQIPSHITSDYMKW